MDDWRRRSIAGGPSSSGALYLDFFCRPSAAHISFPCDGAGGTSELEAATMSTPQWTLTNEAFLLPAADGDSKMSVASPATTDEASPLQPRQCQPVGTAATGGGGSGSRRQLSFDADHVVVSLDNDEAGEEEKEDMSPGRSDGDYEGMPPGRGEDGDEAISPGRGEDDGEAMSSGPGEEDEDDADDEDEEEEEEEPRGPVMCLDCGIVEASLMLMPCRHVCYCADCYRIAGYKTGPAGVRCLVCGKIAKRKHPLSARLEPRKKSR